MTTGTSVLFGDPTPVVVIMDSTADIDAFQDRAASEGATVRIIRGHRCRDRDSLLQEWAAALQFPYYFGDNLDAFDECIADLSWLPGDRYVWIVTQADRVAAAIPTEFLTVVHGVVDSLDREEDDRPFDVRLVLQAHKGGLAGLLKWLDANGIAAVTHPEISTSSSDSLH